MMQPANGPLGATPEICPIILDEAADRVIALQLSRRDFEIISFLDQRLLEQSYHRLALGWPEIGDGASSQAENLDYIFHVGHVGSTLLSRLLGLSPRILALREPAALRRLAELHGPAMAGIGPWSAARWESRAGALLSLWSRTWAPGQRTLLKVTSAVSEIAAALMARDAAPRAILLTVAPETYLATILGGPASRVELGAMAPTRLARLHRRLGGEAWRLEALSEGERAAMSWTCEMAGLAAAASPAAAWFDFEALLARPAETLARALVHLHGEAPAEVVAAMTASPYFNRYSKAPEYGYDAGLRRRVLDQARAEHAGEVRRGLAWLDRAARDHPAIGRLLAVPELTPPA